jgi:integrase
VEFNQRLYGPDPKFAALPVFHDTVTSSGVFVSAARNARMFFTERDSLAQSTIANLKCQLNAVYSEYQQGHPPWSAAGEGAEAVTTRRIVNRIEKTARKPAKKPSLGSVQVKQLLEFWGRASKMNIDMLASRAAQACVAFMRGTASRPEDAIMLRRAFISENRPQGTVRNGLNIFYPPVDEDGVAINFKGNEDPEARFKVMPEKLEDGTPVSDYLWDFLSIAPRSGPLFQKTSRVRGYFGMTWSDDSWSVGDITEHLQRALRDPGMRLGWNEETVRRHTAHCIRTTATTAMQTGGVAPPLVSAILGHKTQQVTSDHYVHYSKEDMRQALAVVGPREGRGIPSQGQGLEAERSVGGGGGK